jgi:transcriptional regulator with XRE-family HTH domain
MIEVKMTLGMKLKVLRISKNMDLKDVSKKSGISIAEISNIENDKNKPQIATIKKLAEAFDYDYNQLYDYLY